MDPDYKNPYTQQWNVGYALQLTPGSAIEIDYVHVLSLRESKTIDINPTRSGVRPLTAAFLAAGRPALGRIDLESSVGRSRYDGLNISYRRRMSNRFSVNTSYVLSRGIAYNGNAAAFRNIPRTSIIFSRSMISASCRTTSATAGFSAAWSITLEFPTRSHCAVVISPPV